MSDQRLDELVGATPQEEAPKRDRLAEIPVGAKGAELATLQDYWTLASAIVRAGMSPILNAKTGERMSGAQVMLAMQTGAEVGLPPMTSLKNVAIINNRPTIWGDSLLALAFRRGLIEDIEETISGEGDDRVATCTIKRKGMKLPVVRTFSVADAKTAGLWDRFGPWKNYPDRMLAMRARGFALRDAAPDALGGFMLAEEVQDMQVTEEVQESRTEALLANLSEAKADEAKPLQTETLFPVEMSGDRDE